MSTPLTWPLTLQDLVRDMYGEDNADVGDWDGDRLQTQLDAAAAWVRPRRPRFNWDGDPMSALPEPGPDLLLGILRLAARWHNRRQSPGGLVELGQLGSTRVTTFDPDIDRLLRLGRWAKAVLG